MTKILFVCHGNICRSPMAEFVMKDMVKKAGAEDRFYIDSAAVSREEIGNPIYPPAQRELIKHGILGAAHRARPCGVSGRGLRQDCLHRSRRQGVEGPRREGGSRAP